MRPFQRLTGCFDGNCPGFDEWQDTRDFRVTGYKVAPEDKPGIPDTEDVVTVPRGVVFELISCLLRQAA
jgi:hypothetical protein